MKKTRLISFDWAMKSILRDKSNFDILEAFLSNLLKEKIVVEDLLESEGNKYAEKMKVNRVDLKCRDSQDRLIIIEIQDQMEIDYLRRIMWGASNAVVESMRKGNEYKHAAKVISISIIYHKLKRELDTNTDFIYYGSTNFVGYHNKKPLIINTEEVREIYAPYGFITDVFPEYYLLFVEQFNEMIQEDIDEWIYFFKHSEIREDFKSPGILLLSDRLDYLRMPEDERKTYDYYLDQLDYERGVLEYRELEGYEKGIEEGVFRTAAKMLEIGYEIQKIKEVTGLTEEDIQKGERSQ